MKTALREIAQIHTGDFRLTPSQNLTISGVTPEQKPVIDGILAKHGLTDENERSGLRLNALSCVALPTCGLAWPRASACCPTSSKSSRPCSTRPACATTPSACASPAARTAARARTWPRSGSSAGPPNKYALFLGANYNGTRLNRLVSPSITIDDARRRC